jgi:oligopeptide/dipeptide ABC transporter ATP-binding protein
MQSLGISAAQVNNALKQLNINAAGGKAEIAGSRQSVRVLGNAATALELSQKDVPLGGGRTVKLADFADVIMVLYAGQVCEIAPCAEIVEAPRHPYTKALIDSVARTDVPTTGRLAAIPGDPPDPARLPPGCAFSPRCRFSFARCTERPELEGQNGHEAACHLSVEERVRLHAGRSLRDAS